MADGIDKAEDIPAVESTTTATPHPADESSAAGPYNDLTTERPPVSTSRPDTPIAQSLVGGAGAPSPEPEYRPEDGQPSNAGDEAEAKRGPGRPRKEETEA